MVGARIHHIVRQIDQKLGKAALGSGIIPKNRTEGSVAKGLRQTLSESFPSTGIVA